MRTITTLAVVYFLAFPQLYAHAAEAHPFTTITKGSYSPTGEEPERHQRIQEIYTQAQWQRFWAWHTEALAMEPAPAIPTIDFNDVFVIVAMDQVRTNGGYSIAIHEVSIDNGRPFKISVLVIYPGSAAMTPHVMSRPYHIITLEKNVKNEKDQNK